MERSSPLELSRPSTTFGNISTGHLDDVSEGVGWFGVLLAEYILPNVHVTNFFKPEWKDRLEILPSGGEITLIGKIDKIMGKSSMRLDPCELFDEDREAAHAAEIKALRDKLEATARIAEDFARQNGPWRISERSNAAIKESLSVPDYAGQKFIVYREYENTDGEQFANDLQKILVDCGWLGMVEVIVGSTLYAFPYGVCVWTTESIMGGDTERMQAIGQALGRAGIHMTDRQIWKAVTAKTIPAPNMVLFCIGRKPTL